MNSTAQDQSVDERPSWLAELLTFDRDGDTFVVVPPIRRPGLRIFGGLIAAQALGAAGATVDPIKRPHSLHLYFVRAGDQGRDVELRVHRLRDGRAFDTRRVVAEQGGRTIMEMMASFHRAEPSADWHRHSAPTLELSAAAPKLLTAEVDERFEFLTATDDQAPFAVPPFWIKTRHRIERDPLVRACALTYLSDFGLAPTARPPGTTLTLDEGFNASLDHSVWFHREFYPDQWHRYDVTYLNHRDSRGLVTGQIFDAAGALIASTSQEVLWRL